ncbi:MAG: substrate-binding domain-containing protein [Anaerolineae bacterium]|nr:substrate-binding domain-containing protein [Anaerolineae bacterium]
MTTYERQQEILRLLQEYGTLSVVQIADHFTVSEGTVRNDLNYLEDQQQLVRIRGGATLPNGASGSAAVFQNRLQKNADAKKKISRWASELVTDGDVLLLDASTTAYHMATFLQDRHNITVVTNQIEAGRLLAVDPSKRVILLGGQMRADGMAVTGVIGQEVLRNLHLDTAFISCVGFSLETGLMESDIDEALLKMQVLQSASRVVALVDSSKFGKVGLRPFASVSQIAHIVTDDGIAPQMVERLRAARVSLTICGEHTVQSLIRQPAERAAYKIGFANLSEAIPFAVDVRRGIEKAAQKASNIDLIYVDNALDGATAIRAADDVIAQQVDLVIEYQIDESAGHIIMNKFKQAHIPVIAIDIPMVGATYFGVDNFVAGKLAGEALGRWISEHWHGQFDALIVLEEKRAGTKPAARIQGQLHGLHEALGSLPTDQTLYLDSGNNRETSYANTLAALERLPGRAKTAFICFNDDAALGALAAVKQLNRQLQTAIVGQGADRPMRDEIRKARSPIIGSTAFMPERYGECILDIALKRLTGEPLPPAIYMEHVFINHDNIDDIYPEDAKPVGGYGTP